MTRQSKTAPVATLYRWRWVGKAPNGHLVRGESLASQRSEVERKLAHQQIIVKRIRRRRSLLGGMGRIRPYDVMLFSRQMATMIRAGIPVLQAFQAVSQSVNKPAMSALVQALINDVTAGASISEALKRHPQHFDQLFINMVEAGEQAGSLDLMLERIASYREKAESLKSRVKKALYYPLTVVLVAIAISALLLVKVVPQFERLFDDFGGELPTITRVTIALSDTAQANGLWGLIVAVGVPLAVRYSMQRWPTFAYRMHALLLHLPVVGSLLDKACVARYARTLATTFGAGVPLVEALSTAAGATGSPVYERTVQQVAEGVASGQQLHFAMQLSKRFPALTIQMISIGEESGSLDAMLQRIADYYEEEVDNSVDTLTTLLEPLVIVVLGALVGGLVVSMYLPIFELGSML